MKSAAWAILILTATLSLSVIAFAQQKVADFGEREFENSCADCHGMDAKGHGVLAANLKAAPPDLTLLTKKNGGVFSVERIYAVIDGRTQIASHGSRDMPIWGARYMINAAEHFVGVPYSGVPPNLEGYIRTRILNLIDYLRRVQQK
jgi:mono/diheme cytochrome c family protein